MEKLFSSAEAAVILGVVKSRVHQLVRVGKLPRRTIGNALFFTAADLEKVKVRPTGRPPRKPHVDQS